MVLAEYTGFEITGTQLQPIVDAVTHNLPIILTAGLSIMAVTLIIRLVPRFVKIFTK